jgi:hypothetical protein
MDEFTLGVPHCLFYRVKLLGKIETVSTLLNHRDQSAQMPLGTAKSFDDRWMA